MSTTISGTSGVTFPDSTSMQTGQQACKAWVNFDGTFATSPFTIANGGIRAAYNVSSVTDNGTGDYTVNFTTAMSDANYSVQVIAARSDASSNIMGGIHNTGTPYNTSSIRVTAVRATVADLFDASYLNVAVFR